MPGPSIVNRAAAERQAAAVERKTYYLTDPFCKEIHGVEVTDAIRQNGLRLTSQEAMSLLAAGAVSTDKAMAGAAADAMKANHEALTKKRQDAIEANRLTSAENDAATLHNLGQTSDGGAPSAGQPAKPGDGSLSSGEVDKVMASTPEQVPPSPAATWAGQQSTGA